MTELFSNLSNLTLWHYTLIAVIVFSILVFLYILFVSMPRLARLKQEYVLHDMKNKLINLNEPKKASNDEFVKKELSHFLNQLQESIETIDSEEGEYIDIEMNTGKLRLLQGRLKAITKRLDGASRGYLLSCLINMGVANNPFVLEDLDFSGAECEDELFYEADLSRIVAHDIDLNNTVLSEARLENAKLSYANLNNARLDEIRASSAYLNSTQMKNCYLKGADLQRSYLIEADLTKSYLSECNLEGAIMREANLTRANLGQSKMFAVNLSEANLYKAIVKDSLLQNATLSEANFTSAYLTGSDLDSADCWQADFSHSILIGTNFSGAYLNEAKFYGKYYNLVDCQESDLEKLQEQGIGVYASEDDHRFDTEATNFSKCKWWQAKFDKDAAETLWKYLSNKFAPPNGLELSEAEWAEFKEAEAIIKVLIES